MNDLAFSADGRMVASAGDDGLVRLWMVATGCEIRRFPCPEQVVRAVALCPKGRLLACSWGSGSEQQIGLFDLMTGKERCRLAEEGASALSLAFLPDGKRLVSTGFGGSRRIWDVDEALTKQETRNSATSPGQEGVIGGHPPPGKRVEGRGEAADRCAAHTADGRLVARRADSGVVQLWEVEGNKLLRSFDSGMQEVRHVALSPDSCVVAAGGEGGDVLLWDASTGRLRSRLGGHCFGTGALTFSPDGKTLATASWKVVRLWDVASGCELLSSGEGHQAAVRFVSLSEDGRTLITGDDGTTAVWDVASGRLRQRIGDFSRRCRPLLFTADGKNLVTESGGQQIVTPRGYSSAPTSQTFWVLTDGRYSAGRKRQQLDWNEAVCVSPDLRTIFTWFGRGDNPSLGFVHAREVGGTESLRTLAETGGRDGLVGRGWASRVAAVSADGKFVALADWFQWAWTAQESLGVWDVRTGKPRRLAPFREAKEGARVVCLALSADGARLAAGWTDGVIEQWDTSTGRALPLLEGHRDSVNGLAISPDGRTLASVGADGTLRLWETATCQERHRFEGGAAMTSVGFGDGGRVVVSGAADTTATLWAVWPATRCAAIWSEEERDTLWDDLGSDDAATAFRAARALAERPEQAAPLIRSRLLAFAAVEVKQTGRLQRAREWLTTTMQRCGLRETPEAALTTEQLRAMRAAEALEHCASSEAREVLRALEAARESSGRR